MTAPAHDSQRTTSPWHKFDRVDAEEYVSKLQRRIYQATRAGEFKKVCNLQDLLVKCFPARYLAVLRVTSNKGRLTAGVDDIVITTPDEKWRLVEALQIKNHVPKPVRVVYIPKPDGTKRRLGIPTMDDRVAQALVLMALEPEWEAKFEPHSFGFRPGRSPIDAVQYIGRLFVIKAGQQPHPGWVLDADISKCFDNIDHEALLAKLKGSPFQGIVRAWLKSGAITRIGFEKTEHGTPQGGVISPLLANIALDGMERVFGIYNKHGSYVNTSTRAGLNKLVALYRYADDFIVLAPTKQVLINHVVPTITAFLASVGLTLSKAKTRITNVVDGFDFLGFHFQRFYRKNGEIKTFVYQPARSRLDRFLLGLRAFVREQFNSSIQDLIARLNSKIRGFCNYFKWSNAHEAFAYLGHRIFWIMWSWARHRHQRKRGAEWLKYQYWRPKRHGNWIFSFKGVEMVQPSDFTLEWWKRPAVRIHSSPHDPEERQYWQQRSTRAVRCNPAEE